MRNRYGGPKRLIIALSAGIALCLPTLVVTSGTAAAQDTDPEILSNWETSNSGYSINRDCGYSVPVPNKTGQDLWLFCDSIPYEGSTFNEAILGTDTAAEGPTPQAMPLSP
jgi:hypothetical protein